MKLSPFKCPVCGKPRGAGHPKCSEIMRQRAIARENASEASFPFDDDVFVSNKPMPDAEFTKYAGKKESSTGAG